MLLSTLRVPCPSGKKSDLVTLRFICNHDGPSGRNGTATGGRREMGGIDETIAELRELRRGRGLLAGDVHIRVGPRIRLACGIVETDRPATARRKLALGLTERSGRLPADLRLAVLAALALHEATDQKFLHQRMEWVASQFDRDPRTARRRMDDGFEALAALIEAVGEDGWEVIHNEFAPEGWYVESLRSTLRMDLEVPKLIEERCIIAAADELDEIVVSLSAVPGQTNPPPENEIQASMIHGGEITEVFRPTRTYARFVVRLPRPLKLGERHEYAVEFTGYARDQMRPYYLLTPLRRFDRFSLRVRFGVDRLPSKIWRLNGVHPLVADDFTPSSELLGVDPIRELSLEFIGLRQGLRYGVQWGS